MIQKTALKIAIALAFIATAPNAFSQVQQPAQPATEKHPILDPVLKRNAFYITAPAGWQFDGATIPGTNCQSMPAAVYKTSSPDGLTGVYVLPRFDWAWSTGRMQQQQAPAEGCMPWQQITAKQLLDYLVPILHVAFEREGDPAEIAQIRANLKRRDDELNAKSAQNGGMATFSSFSDFDRYVVRYEIDHHQVEEVLQASFTCSDKFFRQMGAHFYQCSAFVKRMRAPFGKLQAAAPLLASVHDEVDMQWNQQWMALWAQRSRQFIDGLYQAGTQALLDAGKRAGEARMREHDAFMNSMQQQRDVRNLNFAVGQYNKQHASDNFVDYVLDCTRLSNNVSVSGPHGSCQDRQTAP
jgi:hypothetical protein